MQQTINFTTITACGECCTNCPKRLDGICKGCIEADGYVPEWAGSGRCKVHECARKHHVQFCGLCDAFPCGQLTSIIHWNPNITEHLCALAKSFREQESDAKLPHASGNDHDQENPTSKNQEVIPI